jgi:hypothetical protein
MDTIPVSPTTAGPAFRVSLIGPQISEAYEAVYAVLDARYPVVHVLSPDTRTHYLTIPLGSALIEWLDPRTLEPRPRIPPLGPGAFQRMQEGMQRMMEGVDGPG